MKIAYLVLCHTDPVHVARLSKKLTSGNLNAVFVHIDAKSASGTFKQLLGDLERVHVLETRLPVWWGGYSAVKATNLLLRAAFDKDSFERFVLLQGADYPLLSNDLIGEFFERNRSVDFIRACNATRGKTKYVYAKARYYLFYDKLNIVKRVANKITRLLDLKLRTGKITLNNANFEVFWGCAQWALTRNCVDYVLQFQYNKVLENYFNHIFPADETFFHSVIFNSKFAGHTQLSGPEPEVARLVELRNLHYFEYPKMVRIFDENDYNFLSKRPEMFVRKVTTERSSTLLDLIDVGHFKNGSS